MLSKPWFTLKGSDDYVRKMTRKQYYDHKRYLRVITKVIAKNINQQEFDDHLCDLAVYGVSPVRSMLPDIFIRDWNER